MESNTSEVVVVRITGCFDTMSKYKIAQGAGPVTGTLWLTEFFLPFYVRREGSPNPYGMK